MSKLPSFGLVISVGNLKPKLKWFFKPQLKPKNVLLNCPPALGGHALVVPGRLVQVRQELEHLYLARERVDGALHGVQDELPQRLRGNVLRGFPI